ncbi:hypothetical protein BH23GEM6_BH23GEM6_24420 [soil metagenome]
MVSIVIAQGKQDLNVMHRCRLWILSPRSMAHAVLMRVSPPPAVPSTVERFHSRPGGLQMMPQCDCQTFTESVRNSSDEDR